MSKVWTYFQDIQDRIIPCLRELKGVSSQELVDVKIIEVGVPYDFNSWHWTLVAQNEILEKVKVDADRIEVQIKAIQDKIFVIVAEVLRKKTI